MSVNKLSIVLATQRSGSTVLCKDIMGLGGLGVLKEHFTDLVRAYRKDVRKGNKITVNQNTILEILQAEGTHEKYLNIAGTKVMIGQCQNLCSILGLNACATKEQATDAFVDWAFDHFDAVNLVVLLRESILDQCISVAVAKVTKVYHHRDTKRMKGVDPYADKTLDFDEINQIILEHLPIAVEHSKILRKIADKHAEQCLFITYDELSNDPDGVQKKLYDNAVKSGFKPEQQNFDRLLRKLIDKTTAQEVRASFKDYIETKILDLSERERLLAYL